MDIRNFFGSKGVTKASGAKADSKPKEEEKKKKRAQVLSDSDSEEEVAKKSRVSVKKTSRSKKEVKSPPQPKLKEVNAADFFNSKAVTTNPVKRKSPEKR